MPNTKAESWLVYPKSLLLKPIAMLLERHFVEKPWGRTGLPAAFGAPAVQRIGEIWYEAQDGRALPLLVKWLFTSEKLSIQVHPSDAEAHARGLASGKEECWYIVEAEPGAVLGLGTTRALSAAQLRNAALSGEIEQLMEWKPVSAGDFFYVPAGTVHAIGAGITLVEVQQPADITYRLYDYGRPRELHLEDGVAVAKAKPYSDPRSGNASGSVELVSGPHFWVNLAADTAALAALAPSDHYWLVPVKGMATFGMQPLNVGHCMMVETLAALELGENASMLVAGLLPD